MELTNEKIQWIIEAYGDMVYRLAFSMTKNKEDAEDVSQDVFIKLVQHAHKLEDNETYLKAWLIRVTINRCKDLFSSFWKKNIVCLDDDIQVEMEETKEVYEGILKLPKKYRIVIYLYYYEEYSVNEISDILGKSSGTIKWQLSKARELLKKYIERDDQYVQGCI